MKEKKVTEKNIRYIQKIFKEHTKDADDYSAGIKEAKEYLLNTVEMQGLFDYINDRISSTSISNGERLVCYELYDQVSNVYVLGDSER